MNQPDAQNSFMTATAMAVCGTVGPSRDARPGAASVSVLCTLIAAGIAARRLPLA